MNLESLHIYTVNNKHTALIPEHNTKSIDQYYSIEINVMCDVDMWKLEITSKTFERHKLQKHIGGVLYFNTSS